MVHTPICQTNKQEKVWLGSSPQKATADTTTSSACNHRGTLFNSRQHPGCPHQPNAHQNTNADTDMAIIHLFVHTPRYTPVNHITDLAYATHFHIKAHLSLIQQMAAMNNDMNLARAEKIKLTCGRPPSQCQPFTVSIAETREISINNEEMDKTPVKIYTDISGQDGQVGAATVLYLGNSEELDTIVHYHLGTTETHLTYNAKWVGVLLAIWLLVTLAKKCNMGSW